MSQTPHRTTLERLQKTMATFGEEAPEVMGAFGRLHQSAVKAGTLDARTKELIALAIAITVRCNGCIAFHVHDAIEAGASREEIIETIGVAVLMGGGPSMVYGCEAFEALEEFTAAG
jgi:AhpD family alkylhydroperoxidase